ncbi:unnamed protein product [Peniophora sp. CBMAI 1063]|nr:unnamed protein product [Peniophora sp. CBMAI 1063]
MSYTGKTAFYSVKKNTVTIRISDARSSQRPPDDGTFELLELEDPTSVMWRRKIGRFISSALNLVDRGQSTLKSEVPWILSDFPSHYALYCRRTSTRSADGTGKARKDVYLYGASHRFASPAEFAAHAIWLMRGRSGQCVCKYCVDSWRARVPDLLEDGVKQTAAAIPPSARAGYSQMTRGTKRKFISDGDIGVSLITRHRCIHMAVLSSMSLTYLSLPFKLQPVLIMTDIVQIIASVSGMFN